MHLMEENQFIWYCRRDAMIRNQWYVILESNEVRPGKVVRVTRLGEELVLWRTAGGKLVCMVDRCSHLGAQLSQGKVCPQEDGLRCRFHGFEFDPNRLSGIRFLGHGVRGTNHLKIICQVYGQLMTAMPPSSL